MNIFVTVGTTPFDALISSVDNLATSPYNVYFQISDGKYIPKNGKWIIFGDVQPWYEWADLVICHAGAGTVYTLLEAQKKILIVPNIYRRDHHQVELAKYVERCNFASVLWDVHSLSESCIMNAYNAINETYSKYSFFAEEEISGLIIESMNCNRSI